MKRLTLYNPHGSDVTSKSAAISKTAFELYNPHGSDVTDIDVFAEVVIYRTL